MRELKIIMSTSPIMSLKFGYKTSCPLYWEKSQDSTGQPGPGASTWILPSAPFHFSVLTGRSRHSSCNLATMSQNHAFGKRAGAAPELLGGEDPGRHVWICPEKKMRTGGHRHNDLHILCLIWAVFSHSIIIPNLMNMEIGVQKAWGIFLGLV